MTETEFNEQVDETLLNIEEALDEAETDMDYVTVGGVLTITTEQGIKIIFTRQAPVSQLWVATPGGGFHFDLVDDQWVRDSDALALPQFLQQTLHEYAGEELIFDI